MNENVSFADYASGIRLPDCSKLAINRKKDNDATTRQNEVIVNFSWRYFVSLVKCTYCFMPISSLILEWCQFSFIRDWPKIQKLEIPRLSFAQPISKDWDKLEIPVLLRMFLIKYYWMLQNASVTAFTVSELLRENQKRGQNYPGKKAACLVGQPCKILNFVCKKFYDLMEPKQPAFTIPSQVGKGAGTLP